MKISEALIEIRKNIRNPEKNGLNPMFNSSYPKLNDVLKAISDSLPEEATYSQPVNVDKITGNNYLELHIITDEEEKIVSNMQIVELEGNRSTNKLQMFGQSITYLRRYQLQSYFGLGADDNDGSGSNQDESDKESNGNSNHDIFANENKRKLLNNRIEKLSQIMDTTNRKITDILISHFPDADFTNLTNEMADKILVDLNKQIDQANEALAQMV
ncbi:ERF family protein [Companilactobacillus allii]|uniref:Uncharacterized protein n=1 Tax=Companilactobacillus allii TaxID=1847728 RepID=A0A1P8Q4D7_9LACO|nr:ERF family protein [Companilactobacillus allii]APX72693.1 hypothetical protein BTM29_09080 [Companilactobacillus allii]USQ69799.1 ERF family protein [Companilactobacillus allii]